MDQVERMQLTLELKQYAAEIDIDLFGITGVDEMNAHGKIGRRPVDLMPTAQAIVVSAIGLLDPYSRSWTSPQSDMGMQSAAATNISALRQKKLCKFLREKGYTAYSHREKSGVFTNSFLPLTRAFQQAGLGYIGKSNLAISEKYGPRMILLGIVTDAPLIPDTPYTKNLCEDCNICEKFCTSKAILGDYYYNGRLCEAVVNCTPNCVLFSLTGWSDCDICMRKCPRGEYKWTAEERKGNWWDVVERNKADPISQNSIFLKRNIHE
jgi:epoxyqueuosine reductase